MARLLVFACAFSLAAVVFGDALAQERGPSSGCLIAFNNPPATQQTAPVARTGEMPPAKQHDKAAAVLDALRPPQDEELQQLGGVLQGLAHAGTAQATMAALGKGQPFTMERFGVLLADARSIVIRSNAQALREQAARSTKVDPETRRWIEQRVQVLETCAPARFQGRGGPAVLKQVTALVAKHQSQLEPFLFQSPEQVLPVSQPRGNAAKSR